MVTHINPSNLVVDEPAEAKVSMTLPLPPDASQLLEAAATDEVFLSADVHATLSPTLPPSTASPLASPLPAATETLISSPQAPTPRIEERIVQCMEQLRVQDAAFDATEHTMKTSGWSSADEIEALRARRATIHSELENKIKTLKAKLASGSSTPSPSISSTPNSPVV